MKRIIVLLLAITLISISLVSCSNSPADSDSGDDHTHETPNDISVGENALGLEINGIKITPNAEAKSVIEALGEPLAYTEEPSCGFEENDRTYQYNGFIIDTVVIEQVEYIYYIQITNDMVETPEGAYIGMTPNQIEDIYAGKFKVNENGHIEVSFTGGLLEFFIKTGACSSITYKSTTIPYYEKEK